MKAKKERKKSNVALAFAQSEGRVRGKESTGSLLGHTSVALERHPPSLKDNQDMVVFCVQLSEDSSSDLKSALFRSQSTAVSDLN